MFLRAPSSHERLELTSPGKLGKRALGPPSEPRNISIDIHIYIYMHIYIYECKGPRFILMNVLHEDMGYNTPSSCGPYVLGGSLCVCARVYVSGKSKKAV